MLPSMPRPPIHHLTNPKAWSVLIAPVRLEIVEAMRMIAPCSIAEVAETLDRPADTLYRHIEKLKRVGAVVDAGTRRAGRRLEQVYDLVADDFRIGFKDTSERAANKSYNETLQSILKIASRTTRDSASACQLIGMGEDRNVVGKIEHAWLTHAEFLALRDMFLRAKQFMDARKGRRDGRLYLMATIAVPVTRKRGAKRKPASARSAAKPASPKRAKGAS